MQPPQTEPGLIPEDIYEAVLANVRCFPHHAEEQVGLMFRITSGPYTGHELTASGTPHTSSRGRLAALLCGMGGADGSVQTAHDLIGKSCRISVQHKAGRAGKRHAVVAETFR